jgi:chromatin remodeling complex protein RSC6
MVRASATKQTTTTTTAPVIAAPVATKATKAATKSATKATKTTTPKTEAKSDVVEPTIVAEPVVVTESVPEVKLANEIVDNTPAITKKITEFGAKLQQIGSIFTSMKGDFKSLEKMIARELKAAQKSSAKKAKRAGNRQPSGFVKPTRISDELAVFLGKTIGTEMARTEVSKEINEYIREHKLQNKKNGRIIEADAKLSTLLKLSKEDELSYFNLQRYMKSHFIKQEPAAVAVVAASV